MNMSYFAWKCLIILIVPLFITHLLPLCLVNLSNFAWNFLQGCSFVVYQMFLQIFLENVHKVIILVNFSSFASKFVKIWQGYSLVNLSKFASKCLQGHNLVNLENFASRFSRKCVQAYSLVNLSNFARKCVQGI